MAFGSPIVGSSLASALAGVAPPAVQPAAPAPKPWDPSMYDENDPASANELYYYMHPERRPPPPVTPPQFLNLGKGNYHDQLMAINPRTGKPEQVLVDYGSGGFDPFTSQPTGYYFPSDGNAPSTASAGMAGGYSGGNDGSVFGGLGDILKNPANALWALTTGQTGGMTGAQALTGGDAGKGVLQDVAGLGAGAGLAQALPALGLGSPAAAGGMSAADAAALGGMTEGAGAGSAAAGGTAGAGGAGTLADAGMDLGAFGASNPYTSGVTQAEINAAAAAGGGATASSGLSGAGGTAAGGAGVGAVGAAAGAGVGGVTLEKLLKGDVGAGDLASAVTLGDLGKLLATGASMYGANEQANKLDALARDYMKFGEPSRARYEASFDPNFDISKMTGLQGAMDTSYQGLLRGLSTQGNPFGNPGGLTEAMKYITGNVALPALQQYRNQQAATGGYGAFSSAAPSVATGGINAGGNVYSDLGRGIANFTNPPTSLEQAIKAMRGLA